MVNDIEKNRTEQEEQGCKHRPAGVNKDIFKEILDDSENIIWQNKPVFIPFLMSGIPFLIFGIIWGFLDYHVLEIAKAGKNFDRDSVFFYGFMAIHTFPCWGAVLNQIYLFFVYDSTFYALTNKRIIIRSGIFGIDYQSMDHDRVSDVAVNINPFEKLFKVGTVKIFCGAVTSRGYKLAKNLKAIEEPYKIYKKIKTVSVDVKTDWNYPNTLRPDENPGYSTGYNKEK